MRWMRSSVERNTVRISANAGPDVQEVLLLLQMSMQILAISKLGTLRSDELHMSLASLGIFSAGISP